MRKLVVILLGLSIILSAPCCMARPMGMGYGGGYYGGGMRPNTQFYYRPVMPVTPAMTRHNTVPATPISCLGTGSYAVIGNNVMPCKSAAATRIKVTNKSSIKKNTKSISKNTKNQKDKDV